MNDLSDTNQLNEYVRETLKPYLDGNYRLKERGQELVIAANARLDRHYAEAHNLPVADWCFKELSAKLLELPPRHFTTLLDVCAGTGFVSLNLMRKKLFSSCVALDINGAALQVLRERAARLGIEGIETRAGDIMRTDFASNSFAAVMGNSFLHHLPDNARFLREMYRILEPGGVLCLTHEPTVAALGIENYFSLKLKGLLRIFGWRPKGGGEIPLTDIWQYRSGALRDLLLEIGFQEVRVRGRGRISAAVGIFLERIWIRGTGKMAPNWIFVFRRSLAYLEELLGGERAADECASCTISARK